MNHCEKYGMYGFEDIMARMAGLIGSDYSINVLSNGNVCLRVDCDYFEARTTQEALRLLVDSYCEQYVDEIPEDCQEIRDAFNSLIWK